MKNLWFLILCKVFICKSLKFRKWILFYIRFFKIKLILLKCRLLSEICKFRTYFIICIIIFVLFFTRFSKIVPSGKLWCLRFSFDQFVFNRNIFLIRNLILLFNWIYHAVRIIFKNFWILFIFLTSSDNNLMVYFCKSFIFLVILSMSTWFIKRSLIFRRTILYSCLTKNRIHSPCYLVILLILEFIARKFLTF
jgi:hypothetical protein